MKNILIATPSYDGKLDVWYTNALLETVLLGFQNETVFKPIFLSYDALIQRSRNDLFKIAVENNFDGILWIDSDIEWEPKWAVEIVNRDKDIIGLPVIKKSLQETYNVKCNPEDLVTNEDGLISVLSVGTGFLYMGKKAIDYLWENSEEYSELEKTGRMVFSVNIKDGQLVSEDVSVCNKLKDGGFDIFIDPSKTCNHVGNLKYFGNFAEFINKVKSI
jgi:hypothetical protein